MKLTITASITPRRRGCWVRGRCFQYGTLSDSVTSTYVDVRHAHSIHCRKLHAHTMMRSHFSFVLSLHIAVHLLRGSFTHSTKLSYSTYTTTTRANHVGGTGGLVSSFLSGLRASDASTHTHKEPASSSSSTVPDIKVPVPGTRTYAHCEYSRTSIKVPVFLSRDPGTKCLVLIMAYCMS